MRNRDTLLLPAAALFGLLAAPLPVPAQEVMDVLRGEYSYDRLGARLCGLGDLDHDGVDDFAVGARPNSSNPVTPMITVHSGADRSVLYSIHTILGERSMDSLRRAGDVNQDGYEDFVVGCIYHTRVGGNFLGIAVVYSGVDGAVLHDFPGPYSGSMQGWRVDGAGDVDADGFDDVIVGARGYVTGGTGRARVYSGATGAILHEFLGTPGVRDQFGGSVAGVGDLDRDGHDDVLVGAWSFTVGGIAEAGAIWIYSGRDGSTLIHLTGSEVDESFGVEAYDLGDVNQDGVPDFAVQDHQVGGRSPRISVHSGASAALLYRVAGREEEYFQGAAADAEGDYDGDGVRDLVVGRGSDDAAALNGGSVAVHSGRNGTILALLDGSEEDATFGGGVAFAGNLNGDAFDDLLLAAPTAQGRIPPYWGYAGAVFVVAAGPPLDLLLLAPTVGREAGQADAIRVERATPGATAYLAFSFDGLGLTSLPQFQVDLALHRARPLASAIADASGTATLPVPVPDRFRGRTIWLQAFETGRVSNWAQRLIYWPWNWE